MTGHFEFNLVVPAPLLATLVVGYPMCRITQSALWRVAFFVATFAALAALSVEWTGKVMTIGELDINDLLHVRVTRPQVSSNMPPTHAYMSVPASDILNPNWFSWREEIADAAKRIASKCETRENCMDLNVQASYPRPWLNDHGGAAPLLFKCGLANEWLTSLDYYILNISSFVQGRKVSRSEPFSTIDVRLFPMAWVSRGDTLKSEGCEFEWRRTP